MVIALICIGLLSVVSAYMFTVGLNNHDRDIHNLRLKVDSLKTSLNTNYELTEDILRMLSPSQPTVSEGDLMLARSRLCSLMRDLREQT